MARPREFEEDEVIAKATDLFWSKGYRRTTPRDLTVATGLSKSSLYSSFGNKQALFGRVMDRYVDEHENHLTQILEAGAMREALTRMYGMIVSGLTASDGGRSCLVCTASLDLEPGESQLLTQLQKARERIETVFRARVERAQQAGEIAAHRDPASVSRFLFTINMGLVVVARSGATADELQAVTQQALEAVFT